MKKIFIIGLGPGNPDGMTLAGRTALKQAQLICGYGIYVEQAAAVCPDTPVFTTPMTEEIKRCRRALEKASCGETVAMVCSGDAGVYGMAAPLLELAQEYPPVEIEVVGGVTAAISGAAVLGAPLGHDFAVISLSDLLTDWQVIERRLPARYSRLTSAM